MRRFIFFRPQNVYNHIRSGSMEQELIGAVLLLVLSSALLEQGHYVIGGIQFFAGFFLYVRSLFVIRVLVEILNKEECNDKKTGS